MNNIINHIAEAKAAVAKGFTTKAAQQNAIATLNRGYEKARNWMADRQREEAPTDYPARGEFFAARDVPFDLHNVRDRHLPHFAEYVPGLDSIVKDLIAARAEVKAAPVNKAPPKPAPAPSVEEGRLTCQCCGRPILANTGKIAHHGYQRPGEGWQTASCPGAQHLPFEVSRDELGRYIEALNRRHDHLVGQLEALHWGQLESFTLGLTDYDAPRHFTRRPVKHVIFTSEAAFEQLSAEHSRTLRMNGIRSYKDAEETFKRRVNAEVSSLLSEINAQEVRYEGWKQTLSWTGEGFEAL